MLHATTCVHVEVSFITASSHVRTEPQSVIGHTGGKKKLVWRHSSGADRVPVVVRFPAGP